MPASVQAQVIGSGGCPAGFIPSGTTHVVNGDFSIIDMTSGTDDGGSGVIDSALVGFSSEIPYRGYNTYPPDTYFALYDTPIYVVIAGTVAESDLFPGDPAYGVPAAPGMMYSNGNNYDDPGTGDPAPEPYIFWRQTITGLSPNTTYNIYAYLNNLVEPQADPLSVDDPILEFLIDGVPTSLPFPVPEEPDEWTRNEITFTTGPAQTSIELAMRENQTSINGVDLAIGMVGMEECVPDTSTNNPGILVEKVVDRRRAEVGDTVTYTYTVTNTGTVRLDPVTVNDDRLGPITLAATALDPGQSTTGTAQYTIQPGDLPLTNVATASGTPPSGPPVTSTSTVTVRQPNPNPTPGTNDDDDGGGSPPGQQVGQPPTLALVDPFITKSVNPPFAIPGESATWTITITNPGSIPINNVQVTDTMPAEVEILSVSATAGSVSHSGQTISFSIGSLAPGQSVTITVQTRVRDNVVVPFIITNQACMTSTEHPDARCASATLTSVGQLPATGQSPWSPWRVPLLAGAAGLALVAASLWLRRRGAVQQ